MNNVTVIGRLTKDVELKYTPNGKAVSKFSIAVDRGYGENKEVYFFDITVWGKTAENCSQYLKSGNKVAVSGSLHQDRWEDPDGKKRSKVYINAHIVDFLETKPLVESNVTTAVEEEVF